MKPHKTNIDNALDNTILLLFFLVLALLIVYVVPVFIIVFPTILLLIISYIFGIISVKYLIKGRKEPSSLKKWFSLITTVFVLFLITFLIIYAFSNQTIF